MFEPTPDLAPDLEWMLQSDQVAPETLISALAHEFYPQVFRLALFLLDDRRSAQRAARQTFASAAIEAYRFQGEGGVQAWLFSIALQRCAEQNRQLNLRRTIYAYLPFARRADRYGDSLPESQLDADAWLAIDSLPEEDRLIVLLHYALGWQDAQISALLEQTNQQVADHIYRLRHHLLTTLWLSLKQARNHEPGNWLENLDEFLKHTMQIRWKEENLSANDLQRIAHKASGEMRLSKARQRARTLLGEMGWIILAILAVLAAILGLNRLWPEASPTPETQQVVVTQIVMITPTSIPVTPAITVFPRLETIEEFTYRVNTGDTFPEIARRLNTNVEELRRVNRLPADVSPQPGDILVIPAKVAALLPAVRPTPVTPVPGEGHALKTAQDVLRHLSGNPSPNPMPFHTLWFDAQDIDYGPPGYIGAGRIHRLQLWYSETQMLMLFGSQREVEWILMATDGQMYFAQTGRGPANFKPFEFNEDWFGPLANEMMASIFETRLSSSEDRVSLAGFEEIAGRRSLKIEVSDPEEQINSILWVDEITSHILQKQIYDIQKPGLLLKEIRLNQIFYDINLPQELFIPELPWRGSYAHSYDGSPIPLAVSRAAVDRSIWRTPLPLTWPPPGFDPSHMPLTFQYSTNWDEASLELTVLQRARVFANQTYLGSVIFGDPWDMLCQRSPDGRNIAFISRPESQNQSKLHWFSPASFTETNFHSDDPTPRQFAFAPDSHRLAVFGMVDELNQMGWLYVLDTRDNSTQMLAMLANANSLVWSPDGRYLAAIVRLQANAYEEYVQVIDTQTLSLVYRDPVDFASSIVRDWPMLDWGVEFPVNLGGFEACVAAP
jgi:DNA-directed RNA polymerase specialized sigma24 family protein/LysM repeat protein